MIRSVQLTNFKCFVDQHLNFGPLTFLSGLNGTGKSSVIQALLLLRQSYFEGMLTQGTLMLNGDYVQMGTAKDVLNEGAEEERIAIRVAWDEGATASWTFNYDSKSDILRSDDPWISTDIFKQGLFLDNFHYLQAERMGPRTALEMSHSRVRQHRQLGLRGEYVAHFLSVFEREEIPNMTLSHVESESPRLRDEVEAWLGEVSPGARLHIRSHEGIDLVSIEYSFLSGRQTSNPYRATNVGFGISYTLPVIVALLSSPSGSLVIVENPEAHLHPKGQARMGLLLSLAAAAGVQVVVETHSDHVLNGIRLAVHSGKVSSDDIMVHFFERMNSDDAMGTRVVSPRIDRNGRIDHWPDDFFDQWDRSLETLLEPAEE